MQESDILGQRGLEFLEGPDIVQLTVDKVDIIKSKLKAVQDRQKIYVDQHRTEMEFQVG